MKKFTSKSQRTGEIGENIASRYLVSNKYKIVERNYTKKWGEIDIVAEKGNVLHIMEVKSVLCKNLDENLLEIRPEENLHGDKAERLKRTMQSYISDRKYSGNWQFDLVCVYLDSENKKAKVKVLENLIL